MLNRPTCPRCAAEMEPMDPIEIRARIARLEQVVLAHCPSCGWDLELIPGGQPEPGEKEQNKTRVQK